MKRSHPLRLWLAFFISLTLLLTAQPYVLRAAAPAESDLQAVWQRVQESGQYHFSAEIVQTTSPLPSVRNVGRESQEMRLHLEGQTNLPDEYLHLTLWRGGGSVVEANSGMELKVEQGNAFARTSGQETWQPMDDFTGTFAPGGDFLAYVAAAKEVTRHAPEVRQSALGPIEVTRYTFAVDGTRFATHMRAVVTEQLAAKGELPPGLRMDLSRTYREMTGQGELWVGADGLPVQQTLTLTFPPRPDDHQIEAAVTVDFAKFRPLERSFDPYSPTSRTVVALRKLGSDLSSPRGLLAMGMTPLLLLATVLLVRYRTSRRLYAAVALAVIFTMVGGPLLRTRQFVAFASTQQSKQHEQEAQQEEQETQDNLLASRYQPRMDPHVPPLVQADAEAEQAERRSALLGSSSSTSTYDDSEYYDDSCETDPNTDQDGDGLTNIEECRLGTLPSEADSDDDGVEDGEEVVGFSLGGQTWYSDPLSADTNNDDLDDGTELTSRDGNATPDDTDSDGTPDLWDRDNDGDGVSDSQDLSPYFDSREEAGTAGTYDGDNPFELILNDLDEGDLTTVEFHVVPTDPDHLQYSMSVFNWTDTDYQGQIQDTDGHSFYDEDSTLSASPNAEGDVRLIPYLEIYISGTPDNLPAEEVLSDSYSISTQELSETTGEKVAYVPLQVVTESIGDKSVAFYGRMAYDPASQWGNAHEVRVVWLVQALLDECDEYKDQVCITYGSYNEAQVVHSYDEEWYLSGMYVREDGGATTGIVYEDPDADTDRYTDGPLYLLAHGLQSTYLAGRDSDNDGELDVTISELYDRFNYTTNSAATEIERWGIADVLTVAVDTHDSANDAVISLAVTDTTAILESDFSDRWTESAMITPTLMVLREEVYRAITLTADDDTNLSWAGGALTVDFEPSSTADHLPEQTLASVSWAPYRATLDSTSTVVWESMSLEDYEAELLAMIEDDIEEDDDELDDAEEYLFTLVYAALNTGLSSTVLLDDVVLEQDYFTDDEPIWSSAITAGTKVALYFINQNFMSQITNASTTVKWFYNQVKFSQVYEDTALYKWFWQNWKSPTMAFIAIAVVAVILLITTVVLIYLFAGGAEGLTYAAQSIALVVALYNVVKLIYTAIMVFKTVLSAGVGLLTSGVMLLVTRMEQVGGTVRASVIGLIVTIVLIVAIFIYAMVSGGITAGSIAFNQLLAQSIAAIIYAILVFIISLTLVGAILMAFVALIDAILWFINPDWSISGWITENIASALYEVKVTTEMDVDMDVSIELQDSDEGYLEGNKLVFSMPLTTTLKQVEPDSYDEYEDFYDEDTLRENSVVYQLSEQTADQTNLSTTGGARSGEWVVTDYDSFLYHYLLDPALLYQAVVTDTATALVTMEAGVNWSAPLNLNTAYYIMGYDCWVDICDKERHFSGSSSESLDDSFIFDVFPATLDDFLALTWSTGLVTTVDADGDGLLAEVYGGLDPNDNSWDADGDDLSDAYELELQALSSDEGGYAVDAEDADTDGDGLSDSEELHYGANPTNTDTDSDGLNDSAEVGPTSGYLFTYGAGKTTRVYSNPADSDEDGDGIDDLAEQSLHTECVSDTSCNELDYAYNPNTWNASPLALYTSLSDADAVVAPGDTMAYTTTLRNNLSTNFATESDVAVTLPSGWSGSPLEATFDVQPSQEQSLVSDLTVGTTAGEATLTSNADAALHLPSTWAWDDPTGDGGTGSNRYMGVALAPVTGSSWDTPYIGAVATQCGFSVEYFNNITLTGTAAAASSCEGNPIAYTWGTSSPMTSVNSNNFSGRWTADNYYFEGGTYTLRTTSDDGVRVYLDNTIVYEDWTSHGPTTSSTTVNVSAGYHTVKVEYFDSGGHAELRVWWEPTSGQVPLYDGPVATISSVLADADGFSGQASLTLRSDSSHRYTKPDIACVEDNGNCFVVFGVYNPTTQASAVYGHRVTAGMGAQTALTVINLSGGQKAGAPSVAASDDGGWVVVWREYGTTHRIRAQRISSTPALDGSVETLTTGTSAFDEASVTWADTRYLVTWSDRNDIWSQYLSADASSGFAPEPEEESTLVEDGIALMNGPTVNGGIQNDYSSTKPTRLAELVPADNAAYRDLAEMGATTERDPLVIYDDIGEQALVVYRATEGSTHTLVARVLAGTSLSSEVELGSLSSTLYLMDAARDPQNGGWVVAWGGYDGKSYYQAVAGDGTMRGVQQVITGNGYGPDDVALACIQPKPILQLTFDDPDNRLGDNSDYGRTVSCSGTSGCPDTTGSGHSGGNGATYDSAETLSTTFDPPDDNFSTSLWFKTTCQNCPLFMRWDRRQSITTSSGNICTSYASSSSSYGQICSSGQNYADGLWHHVTHVAGNAVSGNQLYVDGLTVANSSIVPTCYNSGGTNYCTSNNVYIGSTPESTLTGSLDEVTMYDRALTPLEVKDGYNSVLFVYSLDETLGATTFSNGVNNSYGASCSGTTCPTAGEDGVAYNGLYFSGDDYLTVNATEETVATYSYTFESAPGSEWSSTTRQQTTRTLSGNTFSTYYLGNFGNDTITLDLSSLPTHDEIEIEFELFVLGTWDGTRTASGWGPDYWAWSIDGSQRFKTSFSRGSTSNCQYQDYPYSGGVLPMGVTLYQHANEGGDWTRFQADDASVSDDAIGNDRASDGTIYGDTCAILYENSNYGGDDWLQNGYAGSYQAFDDNEVTSLRVWKAYSAPNTGAYQTGSLTASGSNNAIYNKHSAHSSSTVYSYDHTGSTLELSFQGIMPTSDVEAWGLDNVKVTLKRNSVPLNNASFTLAGWAKRSAVNAEDYIFQQIESQTADYTNLYMGFRTSNVFVCGFGADMLETSATYTDVTNWHHWACTYNATNNQRTLYYDGVQVAQDTADSDYIGTGTMRVGYSSTSTSTRFNGYLDELGVWAQTLSTDDIAELYEKQKVLDESVLMCLLPTGPDPEALVGTSLVLRETTTDLGTIDSSATENSLTVTVDNDNPTAAITSVSNNEYSNATGDLVIGGTASDPTSYVGSMGMKVDGTLAAGSTTTGSEAWAFTWNTSSYGQGAHTLQPVATDAVGHTGNGGSLTLILDRSGPTATSTTSALVAATRNSDGDYLVALSGSVSDPNAGSSAGSGVASVYVLMAGADGTEGNGWQQATVSGSTWTLSYELPTSSTDSEIQTNPSGTYTLQVRATDNVGNSTILADLGTTTITVDNNSPSADLSDSILDDVTLHIPLDEEGGSTIFLDETGGYSAECISFRCPTAGQPGQLDNAANFSDQNYITFYGLADLDADKFTLATWVNPDTLFADEIMTFVAFTNEKAVLRTTDVAGQLDFYVNLGGTHHHVTVSNALTAGTWQHVAGTYDGTTLKLYKNGALIGSSAATGDPVDMNWLRLSHSSLAEQLDGSLDDITYYQRALDASEIARLARYTQTPDEITHAMTITGDVVDAEGAGITSAEISFTPAEQISLLDGATIHLPLDEPANFKAFYNTTVAEADATCSGTACPTSGQTGHLGKSLRFDGSNDYVNAGSVALANNSFTVAAWAKRNSTGTMQVFASQGINATNKGLHIGFRANNTFTCAFWSNDLNTTATYTDLNWHHWACTYDATTNQRTLYRDGVQVAQATAGADFQGTGNFIIGSRFSTTDFFNGWVDEVLLHSSALTAHEIGILYEMGSPTWHAVTLAGSGAGVSSTTWSYAVPEGADDGIEGGIYQLNMRATDTLGNVTPLGDAMPLWRGEIDTQPPTLTATSVQSGVASPVDNRQSRYTCSALDFNLDEEATCLPAPTVPINAVLVQTFDETSDTTSFTDQSGEGNNGTCSSTGCPATNQAGQANGAAYFDGGNDLLGVANTTDINLGIHTQLSVSGWFRATDPTQTNFKQVIYEQGGATRGLNLYVYDGLLYGGGWNADASQSNWGGSFISTAIDSGWHHVTLTLSGGTTVAADALKLYLDGVLINSASGSQLWEHTALIGIGGMNSDSRFHDGTVSGTGHHFEGYLDQFMVHGRALTATEVASLHAIRPTVPSFEEAHKTRSTYDDVSPWYAEQFTDTTRLYTLAGDRTYSGHQGTGTTFQACDANRHCTFLAADDESVFQNVAEAQDYTLVYELSIPTNADYRTSAPIYAENHSTTVGNFDRVAYYLELVDSAGTSQWIYTSMQAFTTNPAQISVPVGSTSWEQAVSSLTVATNVSGITTGSNLSTGNIEFWSHCYEVGANSNIGGSGTTYDFDDTRNTSASCYGSMQIHNYGAAQPLLSWNRWAYGTSNNDIGIGKRTTSHPDWTFAQNAGNYTSRTLYVLVRETDSLAPFQPAEAIQPPAAPNAPMSGADERPTQPVEETLPDARPIEEGTTDQPSPAEEPLPDAPPIEGDSPVAEPAPTDARPVEITNLAAEASATDARPALDTDIVTETIPVTVTIQDDDARPDNKPLGSAPAILATGILTPADNSVLTSTAPLTVTGFALAPRALRDLTVTLNGAPFHSQSWTEGAATTAAAWSAGWTPAGEGSYEFSLTLRDWDGGQVVETVTVLVDTQAPTVLLGTDAITTTHLLAGIPRLSGSATDSAQLSRVSVQVNGGRWQPATLDGSAWQWPWFLGETPDGETFDVTARATDLAGQQSTDSRTMTVDLVPPQPMTLTLAYTDAGNQSHPVQPGQTLTNAVSLRVTWDASDDGSGIAGYAASWSQDATTPGTLTAYPGAGSHSQTVGEAQRWYAHVLVRDGQGNIRTQVVGPIFVDAPRTPDLVSDLGYHDWGGNLCSLVGVDRRASEAATLISSLTAPQRLHITWDAQNLRFSWSGANWDQDGDLYLYLDTQPGGADRLWDPYATPNFTPTIYLPGNFPVAQPPAPRGETAWGPPAGPMQADFLVQVEDSQTMRLHRWDGSQWIVAQVLDASHARFVERGGGQTDILLPFAWLNIPNPAAGYLALVGVATEEESLRLWATMPERNPVSSSLVVNPLAATVAEPIYTLIRPYTWSTLTLGECANGRLGGGIVGPWSGPFQDSDVRVWLTAEPTGSTYGFFGDELFWVWDTLFGNNPIPSQLFRWRDVGHPPLGNGQTLNYTLHYENRGSEAATGVKAALTAWYALNMPNSQPAHGGRAQFKLVDIGTIPAGAAGTLPFTGQIDFALAQQHYQLCLPTVPDPAMCMTNLRAAGLNADLYDSRTPYVPPAPQTPPSPPLEWTWADHEVDHAPPGFVGISEPAALVKPGLNTVTGYAYDASPVPLIRLEVQGATGTTSHLCTDDTPKDGQWRCEVDMGAGSDGATVALRVQAVDQFGQASPWGDWRTLTFDSTPPVVTAEFEEARGVVTSAARVLHGRITDDRDIRAVEVCRVGGKCEPATVEATTPETDNSIAFDDVPAAPIPIDGTLACPSGNRIVRTFEVPDAFTIGDVDLGFTATHANREALEVTLTSPTGITVRAIFGRPDSINPYQNWDVRLSDQATSPLHAQVHDDVAEPYFERRVRPDRPLDAFNGEASEGTWTMRICQLNPTDSGSYLRARLWLAPQTTILYPDGLWSYTIPNGGDLDHDDLTLGVYGIDRAGNRTEPLTVTYALDSSAPELQVLLVSPEVSEASSQPALGGLVADGSGVVEVSVWVASAAGADAAGADIQLEAEVRGGVWAFTPPLGRTGWYDLWVEARDQSGNTTVAGPYRVRVVAAPDIYLPLMHHRAGHGNGGTIGGQ